jgi:hypothetical protein
MVFLTVPRVIPDRFRRGFRQNCGAFSARRAPVLAAKGKSFSVVSEPGFASDSGPIPTYFPGRD